MIINYIKQNGLRSVDWMFSGAWNLLLIASYGYVDNLHQTEKALIRGLKIFRSVEPLHSEPWTTIFGNLVTDKYSEYYDV